jgi:hypothetical protein
MIYAVTKTIEIAGKLMALKKMRELLKNVHSGKVHFWFLVATRWL